MTKTRSETLDDEAQSFVEGLHEATYCGEGGPSRIEGMRFVTGVVGIELEFAGHEVEVAGICGFDSVGYDHDTYGETVVKSDSSCGAEVVSPPTPLRNLWRDHSSLAYAQDDLRVHYDDPESYRSCGVHVHVGVRATPGDVTALDRRRIDRAWSNYRARKAAIDAFCGTNRDPEISAEAKRYCDSVLGLSTKYGQLNVEPLLCGRQPTIEFRQLGQTRQGGVRSRERMVRHPECSSLDLMGTAEYEEWVLSLIETNSEWRNSSHYNGLRLSQGGRAAPAPRTTEQAAAVVRHYYPRHPGRAVERVEVTRSPSGPHSFVSWAEIVEWATFCVLLTEASTRRPGWIIKARDAIGSTRPIDRASWSDFWERPRGLALIEKNTNNEED